MWEILYKMCKELFPDHQEGIMSTIFSVVLLYSYHYRISFVMCSLRVSKHLSIFLERVTGCPFIVFCEVGVKESFNYNKKLEL